jgi:imidazoleglycerol phosphate dehydratase HisB
MSSRLINIERSTRETSIALSLDFDAPHQGGIWHYTQGRK